MPMGRIADSSGNPTSEFSTFMQSLVTLLQKLVGTQGLVAPSDTTANIATIVSAVTQAQGATPSTYPTCQGGTFFYNETTDAVQVTVLVAGVPTIKTVTVT